LVSEGFKSGPSAMIKMIANVLAKKRTIMNKIQIKLLGSLCKLILPWVAELVILGIVPDRIGRYRILDMLLIIGEKEEI
jgi:hypothetical protein